MLSTDRLMKVSQMSFDEFVTEQERTNLGDVPARTKMLILGGMVDWKETLTSWLETYKSQAQEVANG